MLDPVAAIRCRVTLNSGAGAVIDLITGIASTRAACMTMGHKCHDRQAEDHVLSAAPGSGAAVLERPHVSEVAARAYARPARSVVDADPSLRADPALHALNHGPGGRWYWSTTGASTPTNAPAGCARHRYGGLVGRRRQ